MFIERLSLFFQCDKCHEMQGSVAGALEHMRVTHTSEAGTQTDTVEEGVVQNAIEGTSVDENLSQLMLSSVYAEETSMGQSLEEDMSEATMKEEQKDNSEEAVDFRVFATPPVMDLSDHSEHSPSLRRVSSVLEQLCGFQPFVLRSISIRSMSIYVDVLCMFGDYGSSAMTLSNFARTVE